MTSDDTYTQLIEFLDQHIAHYRLLDHPPEGRTEIVSPMRGNKVSQAAKCIVMMVKLGKKATKYVLGVVPGDARLENDEIYFNATRLDRSMALKTNDYTELAKPRLERIAKYSEPTPQ